MDKTKNALPNHKIVHFLISKRIRSFIVASAFSCVSILSMSTATQAQPAQTQSTQAQAVPSPSPTNAYECTQVSLDDIDPALLTKEERVALLDGTLKDSIDNYSTCVSAVQQHMSGGGGGSGGGAGSGDGTGQAGESKSADATTPSEEGAETQTPPNQQDITQPTQPNKTITPSQRGVIPPKDNDKIICKLLYKEIKSIDDPDMLKGLKEQYTNYKCG